MIFLAKFRLTTFDYPDGRKETEETRLVVAENEMEATEKIVQHYNDLGSQYSTTYYAGNIEILETIGQT